MANAFDSGLSSKTVARRLASIKSFNYLIQVELIEDSPASSVRSPKIEKVFQISFIPTRLKL